MWTVVAPHTGLLDALVLLWLCCPRPVAKETYAALPLVRTLFSALEGLAVPIPSSKRLNSATRKVAPMEEGGGDVGEREAARRQVRLALREHKASFMAGRDVPVAIAPEGVE